MDSYKNRITRLLKRVTNNKTKVNQNTRDNKPVKRLEMIRSHLVPNKKDKTKDTYIEPTRIIPVIDQCDVLVVGGGPAGLSATIGAKKAGSDVILVERYGCFGGVITTVGMETLGWYRYEGVEDTEGIGREMERIAKNMGATSKWPYNDSECLDAENFKLIADHLIRQHGVRPLLHCLAVDVMMSDDGLTVTGVIFESKSGRQAITAKVIIDATGDADIAYFAGCAYTTEPVKNRMSVTPVFNCSGVDRDRFLAYTRKNTRTYQDWSNTWQQTTTGKEDHLKTPYLESEFQMARIKGLISDKDTSLDDQTTDLGGTWSALSDAGEATNLNLVHLNGYDCTDVNDLTKAEIKGRTETMTALKALQAMVPGFEKAKLRNFAMTLGTRDSRKIVGKYNLTGHDVLNQARFPDSIGIFPEFLDGYNILVIPTSGRYFQIPLGCLIPKKIKGLLVAGRCVAGDKVSHTAMRNMMACTVTGQGAGVAAAILVKQSQEVDNVDKVDKVDIRLVQEELIRQGVRIK